MFCFDFVVCALVVDLRLLHFHDVKLKRMSLLSPIYRGVYGRMTSFDSK